MATTGSSRCRRFTSAKARISIPSSVTTCMTNPAGAHSTARAEQASGIAAARPAMDRHRCSLRTLSGKCRRRRHDGGPTGRVTPFRTREVTQLRLAVQRQATASGTIAADRGDGRREVYRRPSTACRSTVGPSGASGQRYRSCGRAGRQPERLRCSWSGGGASAPTSVPPRRSQSEAMHKCEPCVRTRASRRRESTSRAHSRY